MLLYKCLINSILRIIKNYKGVKMMKFSKRLSIIFTVILFIVTMFSGILNAYADTTKYSDIYFDSSTPGGSQH